MAPQVLGRPEVALQILLNQGLVEVDRNGTVVITQTVRRGFFPTEPSRRR